MSGWVAQRAGWEVLPIATAPVTVVARPVFAGGRCPKCAGSGADPDAPEDSPAPCPACGGSGEVPDEQTGLPL